MDGGEICIARSLPIDAALVGDVLLRLRRDTPGPTTAWTLGGRGSAELDVDFFEAPAATTPTWTTTARLWDPGAIAVARTVVEVAATASDSCSVSIRADQPLSPWWTDRRPALTDLANAALDELSEELLWQATRDGVAAGTA